MEDESNDDVLDDYEIDVGALVGGLLPLLKDYITANYAKVPCRNSKLSGAEYYQELVSSASSMRMYEVVRMDPSTFQLLLEQLATTGKLPATPRICAGERLMIFLYILGGNTNRAAQECFQHGPEAISRIVRQGIAAVQARYADYITLPPHTTPTQILEEPKFFPYFRDCIEALGGTHIPAVPPALFAPRFRNRKGFCSQNVLAACAFNVKVVYLLPGWEGSAHDGRMLKDAVRNSFHTPQGKYYLGDAGYALNSYTLTPYRGTRYHLKEYGQGSQKPENMRELFNLRHSSLRNVIERTYGSVKNKFPILKAMPSYALREKIGIVQATFAIHNFIRMHRDEFADADVPVSISDDDSDTENPQEEESDEIPMKDLRDRIESDMWRDYLMTIAGRDGEVVV